MKEHLYQNIRLTIIFLVILSFIVTFNIVHLIYRLLNPPAISEFVYDFKITLSICCIFIFITM